MSDEFDFDHQSLSCRVNLLSREMHSAAARLLAPHEVTPTQALLLFVLQHGETMPSRMARTMNTDAANLSRLIRTFEDRGWITREVDDDNRTRAIVRLTAAGKRKARQVDDHAIVIQDAMKKALSKDEMRVFERAMQKLHRVLSDLER